MTAPSLDDYRRERDEVGVGSLALDLVRSLAARITSSYDPRIYGSASSWSEALDDLIQEVVLERLIEEGQLDYALDVSESMETLRSLLALQVRRTLARRRRRSVTDNLLERAREALARDPYVHRDVVGQQLYRRSGSKVAESSPTESELYQAALGASMIPKQISYATERAPAVYSREGLDALLDTISRELPTEFTIHDLDAILRLVLTDWIASDLASTRESEPEPEDRDLSPEEIIEVQTTVDEIVTQLPPEAIPVLRLKYSGLSDQEVAGRLHLSRPTVAKRKQLAFDAIRALLGDASERVQDAAVSELAVRLSVGAR